MHPQLFNYSDPREGAVLALDTVQRAINRAYNYDQTILDIVIHRRDDGRIIGFAVTEKPRPVTDENRNH